MFSYILDCFCFGYVCIANVSIGFFVFCYCFCVLPVCNVNVSIVSCMFALPILALVSLCLARLYCLCFTGFFVFGMFVLPRCFTGFFVYGMFALPIFHWFLCVWHVCIAYV